MGAKDYEFVDEVPQYEKFRRAEYRSQRSGEFRKTPKAPRSKAPSHSGMHQRRNKHWNW